MSALIFEDISKTEYQWGRDSLLKHVFSGDVSKLHYDLGVGPASAECEGAVVDLGQLSISNCGLNIWLRLLIETYMFNSHSFGRLDNIGMLPGSFSGIYFTGGNKEQLFNSFESFLQRFRDVVVNPAEFYSLAF